jgi:hypothetical protein
MASKAKSTSVAVKTPSGAAKRIQQKKAQDAQDNKAAQSGASEGPAVGEPAPNSKYTAKVLKAVLRIKEEFPDIASREPLPMVGEGLTGFLEPFNVDVFNKKFAAMESTYYVCGFNIFSLDFCGSMTPFIPMNEDRVRELIPIHFQKPRMFPYNIPIAPDFGGDLVALPPTTLISLFPMEVVHALLFSLEDQLNAKPKMSQGEKTKWLQVLLSVPVQFQRIDKYDLRYAEALNQRIKIMATANVVALTARQQIYNIYGFKLRKEQTSGPQSAGTLARWYEDFCIQAAGEVPMSKSAVDSALTIKERIFNMSECETIVEDNVACRGECWGRPHGSPGLELTQSSKNHEN